MCKHESVWRAITLELKGLLAQSCHHLPRSLRPITMTNMTNKPNKTWINYLPLEAQPQKCRHWPLALLEIASFRLSTAFTHMYIYIYYIVSASFSEMRFWPMRMSPSLSHYLELYREALQKTPAAARIKCVETLCKADKNTTRKQTAEDSLLSTVKFSMALSSSQPTWAVAPERNGRYPYITEWNEIRQEVS